MIRKVYIDFITQKLLHYDIGWFFRRALQYLLIQSGFRRWADDAGKPLCGPILASLSVTYACNYRCRMCNFHLRHAEMKGKNFPELSTEEWLQAIRDLATLGVSGVGFTGGEPLLRKDIFAMVETAKAVGLITHLNTNAYFLDDITIEKVLDAGTDSVNISLDGATAEVHDASRGYPGAFERAVTAIRRLNARRRERKVPARLKVVAVLSPHNVDSVRDLVLFARDLGTDCIELIPEQPFLQPATKPSAAFLQRIKQAVEVLRSFGRAGIALENSPRHLSLFEHSFRGEKSPLKCFAAYNSIGLDTYGELFPCMPYINRGRSFGNIRNVSLQEFWYGDKSRGWRKEVSHCHDCFLNCQAELNLLFQPLYKPKPKSNPNPAGS